VQAAQSDVMAVYCGMIVLLAVLSWYLPNPAWIPPSSEGDLMAELCRGWSCGYRGKDFRSRDKLANALKMYRNKSIDSLFDVLLELVAKDFVPAVCAAGHFYLFGLGRFPIDAHESLRLLKHGSTSDFWSCH
jgi:hypothetical protein